MPITAAVLHVDPDRPGLARELGADRRITVGLQFGDRLPVVVDTAGRAADRAVWRSLEEHPAVRHIDLVFSDFSDLTNPEAGEVTP